MGKTAIVTGGTHKDVSAMGALALNIREITPELADELIIFHDGISEKEQQIIKQIFPAKFVRYKYPETGASHNMLPYINRIKKKQLRTEISMIGIFFNFMLYMIFNNI